MACGLAGVHSFEEENHSEKMNKVKTDKDCGIVDEEEIIDENEKLMK